MATTVIVERLIKRGRKLLDAPARHFEFTGDAAADQLVNNLDEYPHAFVLACVMDRQIKAERAWLIPHRIAQKLGTFSFERLQGLTFPEITELMTKPEALHRFTETMSRNFHEAVGRIAKEYNGDAAAIWQGSPSSAEVVYRFLQFRGVGPKIATMAVNLLAWIFKIPFADHFSIDISADVHVRRVFGRLGLTPPDPSTDQVIYRARSLHPEFPGLLDFPSYKIGKEWCRPRPPSCADCLMKDLCPSAGKDSD